MESIRDVLLSMHDEAYAAFIAKLIPNRPAEQFIGVRTPELRALAKSLAGTPEGEAFLAALPHEYFEEDQLHAFLLCNLRSFDACLAGVTRFLPFVNNWATCDQLSPPVFRREKEQLLPAIRQWLDSDRVYTVRFAIGMLMQHFLDAAFSPAYPQRVAAIHADDYYINMEIAWYFATALAKQPDCILPYFTQRRIPAAAWSKAVQKCIESRRIPQETKDLLRKLRSQ